MLVDRTAFELSYLRELEPVETWNKNMSYGSLVQSGIEGFIKLRTNVGAANFIHKEFDKQVTEFGEYEEVAWWTALAQQEVETWIELYANDLDKYGITKSEQHHKITLTLPSGRDIVLHGYIDGEGDSVLMENKCRGDWDEEKISREIDLNLQVNMYMLFHKVEHGELPQNFWYQHIRRPCSFEYKVRESKKESRTEFRQRVNECIRENKEYHFYRYMIKCFEDRHERFMQLVMYPMLESFLNWYSYMTHPDRKNQVNDQHWVTPYGLYNPFTEGTLERFRNFRLTGSTLGLRPRLHSR